MSRRTRLLYVVGNFVAGGAERHMLELWGRLDRARFEVEIVVFQARGQFLGDVIKLGWPIHDLRMGDTIYAPRGMSGFARLVGHVLRFRPDVIQGYLFGPNLFAAMAGRLCGVPVVVISKRQVDAFETPRQTAVQRFAHRLATHVVAVSEAVGETSVQLGAPRDRVTVIPNGVDVDRFAGRDVDPAVRNGDGAPVVGSVGCLAARKDYPTLLEALALLKGRGRRFRAVLVGDGKERPDLERRVDELGLRERVQFLGERPDVERLLPGMDVFVLSSREEGIPNALLEAMAAARPAVATAVGGTPEVLEDGRTGWLVPPGDPPALAAALDMALTDRAEAERRGAAAQRATRERMSIDVMVGRHERFYLDALGGRLSA
jgi:glycosyltransferase involved in cell wall biosynthesis